MLALKRSWNTQIKEYFLDIAGFTTAGFVEISPFFDDYDELFNQETAYSFNDALRVGLEALGYGAVKGNWDVIAQEFDKESGFYGGRRTLNGMLREWAADTAGGVLSRDFEDIGDLWENITEFFGRPFTVSINTALRSALAAATTPADAFDIITTLFDQIISDFDAAVVSIGAVADELVARMTFGFPTQVDFDKLEVPLEDIFETFNGGNATGVIVSFDRETRRFEMID